MTRTRLLPAAVTLAAAAWPAAGYADVLIDDFRDGASVSQVFGGPDIFASFRPAERPDLILPRPTPGLPAPLDGVRGDRRRVQLLNPGSDASGGAEITAEVFTDGASVLDYRTNAGASATVELQYGDDMFTVLNDAFSPLDLGGQDAFEFDFLGFDSPGGLPLGIEIELRHTQYATTVIAWSDPPQAGGRTVLDSVIVAAGADFRLDAIRAVPEPASLTLLALGAAALTRRRA